MKWLVSLILVLCTLSWPKAIYAGVIITEVHPNPLSGPEWVELYNDSEQPVSLNNWWLEDQLASPTVIHTLTDLTLAARTYLKIDLSTQKLNNTSDGVTLKDALGIMIDTMSYTTTSPGLSWSRSPGSSTFSSTNPSPGGPHSPPSPSPEPSFSPSPFPSPSSQPTVAATLYLQPSEIMACPETGQQEWLELYNPTDYILDLSEWHVKDSAENLRTVSGTILPHAFGSLSWASGLLNNTGDSLSLLSPENDTLFTAHIGPCQKNTSYIFDQETWKLTTSVTFNTPNTFSLPTPTPSIPSSLLKTSPIPMVLQSVLSPTPSSLSLNSETASDTTKTLPSLPLTASTSALHLSVPIHHPFIDNGPPLDLSQPVPNLMALVSAIIGGTVLLATHGLRLYRLYQHAQVPVPPPRVLFP